MLSKFVLLLFRWTSVYSMLVEYTHVLFAPFLE